MALLETPAAVMGKVHYLAKDPVHDSEKPYYLYLDCDSNVPRTNTRLEERNVPISNARELDISPHQMFLDYGFGKFRLDCPLLHEEYLDTEKVKETLYPEYKVLVQSLFPDASRIEVLEHGVRRRHPQWQKVDRERHHFPCSQPSDYIHIDMTASSAAKCSQRGLGISTEGYRRVVVVKYSFSHTLEWADSRIASLTVPSLWKSIRGTVRDYPLTLCDRRTVDYASQTTSMDLVTSNYVNENTRVYRGKTHQWYYWDALQENEVIAFVQADTELQDRAGVPHTAFEDPRVGSDVQPRESIEARVFAYFD